MSKKVQVIKLYYNVLIDEFIVGFEKIVLNLK